MQIERLLYPITTLGPGERLVIWTIGCSKYCPKCSNPELWRVQPAMDVNVEKLVSVIKQAIGNKKIDGITITGGDPLEQIVGFTEMLPLLRTITDDLLVYTGYTIEEVKNDISELQWEALKQYISVLIDGSYIDELNDNQCVLRGSANQKIIYFDESLKEKYLKYMERGRSIQNVFYNEKMISVGIHNNGI